MPITASDGGAQEISIHKERGKDQEESEPDLLSQVQLHLPEAAPGQLVVCAQKCMR